MPSPTWSWLTPWCCQIDETTDKDGWEYSFDFKLSLNGWLNQQKLTTYVRRRRWIRLRQLNSHFTNHKTALQLSLPSVSICQSESLTPNHSIVSDSDGNHHNFDAHHLHVRLKMTRLDREKLTILREILPKVSQNQRHQQYWSLQDVSKQYMMLYKTSTLNIYVFIHLQIEQILSGFEFDRSKIEACRLIHKYLSCSLDLIQMKKLEKPFRFIFENNTHRIFQEFEQIDPVITTTI